MCGESTFTPALVGELSLVCKMKHLYAALGSVSLCGKKPFRANSTTQSCLKALEKWGNGPSFVRQRGPTPTSPAGYRLKTIQEGWKTSGPSQFQVPWRAAFLGPLHSVIRKIWAVVLDFLIQPKRPRELFILQTVCLCFLRTTRFPLRSLSFSLSTLTFQQKMKIRL